MDLTPRQDFLLKLERAVELAEKLKEICEKRLKWSEENDIERT